MKKTLIFPEKNCNFEFSNLLKGKRDRQTNEDLCHIKNIVSFSAFLFYNLLLKRANVDNIKLQHIFP